MVTQKDRRETFGNLNKSKFRMGSHRVTQFFCILLKPHKVDLLLIYISYLCLLFLFFA